MAWQFETGGFSRRLRPNRMDEKANTAMSRFVNLEFNEESETSRREQAPVKDATYYWGFAQRSFEEGDFEKAMRYYSKVLEFNPRHAAAWNGQVRALIELDEIREAKLWADKSLEHFPKDPDVLAAKAVALARGGDLEGALAYSDSSVEEKGETPYVWLARADVFLARGERRSEFCIDKAMAMASGDWFIAWLASRVQYHYRQFALALKAAKSALEANATQGVVWQQMGFCQRQLGLIDPARHSFTQARELNPSDHKSRDALIELNHMGLGTRFACLWRKLFPA